MTGWRIGYGAGPVPLIRAMAQDPVAIDLEPLLHLAMGGGGGAERAAGFPRRSSARRSSAAATGGVEAERLRRASSARRPEGAFYVYPSIAGLHRHDHRRRHADRQMTRPSPPRCWRRPASPWSSARPSACRRTSASAMPPRTRRADAACDRIERSAPACAEGRPGWRSARLLFPHPRERRRRVPRRQRNRAAPDRDGPDRRRQPQARARSSRRATAC